MAEKQDPHDGEYVGNIFGPKVTLYGAIIILLFVAFILYRHWALGVPLGMEAPEAPMDAVLDSL
jgi:hypothetical protein